MVTLTEDQMPSHTHTLEGSRESGDNVNPGNNYLARGTAMYLSPESLGPMASQSLPSAGGSQPHDNLQPFIAINYIIALVGLYPSRS
jgi:microcystin-dependent protein